MESCGELHLLPTLCRCRCCAPGLLISKKKNPIWGVGAMEYEIYFGKANVTSRPELSD